MHIQHIESRSGHTGNISGPPPPPPPPQFCCHHVNMSHANLHDAWIGLDSYCCDWSRKRGKWRLMHFCYEREQKTSCVNLTNFWLDFCLEFRKNRVFHCTYFDDFIDENKTKMTTESCHFKKELTQRTVQRMLTRTTLREPYTMLFNRCYIIMVLWIFLSKHKWYNGFSIISYYNKTIEILLYGSMQVLIHYRSMKVYRPRTSSSMG